MGTYRGFGGGVAVLSQISVWSQSSGKKNKRTNAAEDHKSPPQMEGHLNTLFCCCQ